MTIQPPLSKDYPLWKRSQDELRLLRLFDLSPEELGRKIERYWKKPFWRRWFASFGMNKKIDVWNYYQHCLAYQAVRPDKLEQESLAFASNSSPLLNELSLVLHQFNVKFETYLEKRCRNPKWIEKHFLEEIKAYKQQLKKTFLTKLNKSLKQIKTGGDRLALKQQAEQEYQQVETLMSRYYHQWSNNFFSRLSQPNFVPEMGIDTAQKKNRVNPEHGIVVSNYSQTVSSPSQSIPPRVVNHQTGIPSLNDAKEWIQTQRHCLNSLIEEGSLSKVETLLQTSLYEIKEVTEFNLKSCDTLFTSIQGKHENYDSFLEHLDHLQRRLKPLLQGGMLLFHPDHISNLTHSQEMWELITRYSQSYLEQSRCYIDKFKNYYLRIEKLYQHSQNELQRQESLRASNLTRRIQELGKSVKNLEQSFKELDKQLTEDRKKFWDEMYAARAKDKEELSAERLKVKEELSAELLKVKKVKEEFSAERLKVKKVKEELNTEIVVLKSRFSNLNAIMEKVSNCLDNLEQPASSSLVADADMPKSNNVLFF